MYTLFGVGNKTEPRGGIESEMRIGFRKLFGKCGDLRRLPYETAHLGAGGGISFV